MSISAIGNNTVQVSCPSGMNLLYCGDRNSQTNDVEIYRSAKHINSTTCECYDFFGIECTAWCTTASLDFEIASLRSKGTFNVTCPRQKWVLGCHIDSTTFSNGNHEEWKSFYPSADGHSSICYDYFGASCIAACATNIKNYKISTLQASGNVTAACKDSSTRDQYYKTIFAIIELQ